MRIKTHWHRFGNTLYVIHFNLFLANAYTMQKVIFSTALFILAMATMLTAATDTGRNGDPEPVSQKLIASPLSH